MKLFIALALVGTASAAVIKDGAPVTKLEGEALRDYINGAQSLFRVEIPKTSHHHKLMDLKYTRQPEGTVLKKEVPILEELPSSFDARKQWPNCPSIGAIRDQSLCGDCWAFGAVESMSDRFCIASNGTQQPTLSAEDVLSCCGDYCGHGCKGGNSLHAWVYLLQEGACTGGEFYRGDGCKPYSFEPCGNHVMDGVSHHRNCNSAPEAVTPACVTTCTNEDYSVQYADDKYYGRSAYVVKSSVDQIKQEIISHGPVQADFVVYEDFMWYNDGIYQYTYGDELGGHSVKIIGWGEEEGTPYWLMVNSWNDDWGENGFFRMIMGTNNCEIEDNVYAGLPRL